ncbi:MAG: toll/interleukin-1 receptor domain-containing protein [Methanosarcina sp.]
MSDLSLPPQPRDPKGPVPAVVTGILQPRLDVFLSHATSDLEHVALVQRQIEALGIRVYLAEHDPRPGTSIAGKVEAAIKRCHVVVVLITTNSINSAYVQQEVGIAHAHSKPIFPIVDKNVDPAALGMLREVEWLELDVHQPAEAMARISESLQPLVMAQITATNVSVSIAPERPDLGTLVLVAGLSLLVGFLIANGGLGE